jgi:serine/threonine-protein kinase
MIGQSIAHYRVTEKLGAGGMGEVYRAADTKLGRSVAIKVLSPSVATDPERLGRLQREAQLLASLNHSHIAAIYGLEESGATCALVMELVEGVTLASRIAEGPLPLEEALPIARQIAEALEYAHEKGIVHRDLKPANIKFTADGKVKVLDFGLAKALSDAPLSGDASQSPTLSLGSTRAGLILGTAGYMSPEQAKGKDADRRADIWAFGVVFFEMLTGKPLFSGETVSETLAHVITQPPNLDALPAGTPKRIRQLLARCLTREPKLRLQAIGEARIAIDEYLANPAADEEVAAGQAVAEVRAVPSWQRALPWALAALAIATSLVTAWAPWRPVSVPPSVARLNVEVGAPISLSTTFGPGAVLSPDGSHFAFVGRDTSQRFRLYVRALNQLEAIPLSGTEGARDPFFSPDGQWIGFIADGKLKKIAVTGGAAVALCETPSSRGSWWAEDGTIILAASNRDPLVRVPDSGGKPEPITQLDTERTEITHRWPQVLPGGKAVLFTAHTAGANFDDSHIIVQDLTTGKRKSVHQGGYHARYLRSGHIVYAFKGTLFAFPFDLKRLEATGQPAPFQEKVATNTGLAGAQFSFDESGRFLYVPGTDQSSGVQILWMNQEGKFKPLRAAYGDYLNPRFSPDGKRLAIQINTNGELDIWVYDWARDTMTRLTFDPGLDGYPQWTPDGKRISYVSEQKNKPGLYWRPADGTGEAQLLLESNHQITHHFWAPDGKLLAFTQRAPDTGPDLWLLPMEGDDRTGWKPGAPKVFLRSPHAEFTPVISPDGRWVAYASNETGESHIYVRPLLGEGGKWQISNAGGIFPRWSKNGKELFFRSLQEQQILVARYRVVGESFQHDKPELWSPGQFTGRGGNWNFDLAPDGMQFAVLKIAENEQGTELRIDKFVLVMNVFEELRRIAPPKK